MHIPLYCTYVASLLHIPCHVNQNCLLSDYIKCTLHRDAWSSFSPYIVSELCALVLRKPTVLTTGSALKNHYLNITLSNIHAIYSSAVLSEETESKPLPENYQIICDNNITIIKFVSSRQNLGKLFLDFYFLV